MFPQERLGPAGSSGDVQGQPRGVENSLHRERERNSFRGLARRVDALGKGQALPKKHPDGGCLRGVFVLGS